jgi:heavy metal translocating P-type ATPase
MRLLRFIKAYRLFAAVLLGAGVALGLDLGGLDTAAHWLLAIIAGISLVPLLWDMIRDLRQGTYGVDILAATAITTALIMGEYWAGMVIVLMLTGGEALEDYAARRARRELDALVKNAPSTAHIVRGRKVVDVTVSEVKVGDRIVIRPGELVPVDATVIEGKASFDESSLTGESLPVERGISDILLSGAINVDSPVIAHADQTAENSQYEQIIKLVKAAEGNQAPFVRLADRYAIPFTIISFLIAGGAWWLSGESIRFLEVLVVATPCPLILAAPIAIISGMSRAAKAGIIIKTGAALERLAGARTFAFDKTGTLTRGELSVDTVKAFNGFTTTEVLRLAASLEQSSNHVVAQAIIQRAAKTGGKKIMKAKHIHEEHGNGLRAQVGGKEILVGRLSLLEAHGVNLPKTFRGSSFQQTAAFVASDGKLAGVITFKDEIRPESKPTLERLRLSGVRAFMMVTGDTRTTARAVGRKLGIKDIHAEVLPGGKINAVQKAEIRPVAFVGDGVNDAPVLTASDLGIALGARGSSAASESADVVIMQDNLAHVADARTIAIRSFKIARQSILIGIGLSVLLMLVFATGHFKPIHGALIQELVDIVVIINALRAHRIAVD